MVNVQSGQLRASISHEIKHFPTTMSLYVVTDVDYAKYVHDGTARTHPSRPGGVLAFPWKGQYVVFGMCNIPAPPSPFLNDGPPTR